MKTPADEEYSGAHQRPTDDRCLRTGKVAHHHRSAALDALKVHLAACDCQAKDRPTLIVYRCAYCSGWHVGNHVSPAHGVRFKRPTRIRTWDAEDEA